MKKLPRLLLGIIFMMLRLFPDHPAFSFEAEGLRSGMTISDAANVVSRRGLVLRSLGDDSGVSQVFVAVKMLDSKNVDLKGPWINLGFCVGGLVAIDHNIDFDLDFIANLQEMISQYGNSGHVDVENIAIYETSSFNRLVRTSWFPGNDRISIAFSPNLYKKSGALWISSTASVSYETKSVCTSGRGW